MAHQLSTLLSIPCSTHGKHHPDTIAFWRSIQMILEVPRNQIQQSVTPETYSLIRTIAWKASNRFPSNNEVQIVRSENPSDGYDV